MPRAIQIIISDHANRKAWEIKEALKDKGIRIKVITIYSKMLSDGVDSVSVKSFLQ